MDYFNTNRTNTIKYLKAVESAVFYHKTFLYAKQKLKSYQDINGWYPDDLFDGLYNDIDFHETERNEHLKLARKYKEALDNQTQNT